MARTRGSGGFRGLLTRIIASILPKTDNTVNLGSAAKRWASVFAVLAIVTSISIGGVIKLYSSGNILIINGSTHINGSLNVTGNGLFIGDLNVTGNITGLDVFTETHCVSYSSTAQTITNTSTYKIINFETNVKCTKITTDGQNFTLPDTGVYSIDLGLQADKSGGATSTIEAILLLDGNQVNGTARQRTVNSNNEVGYFSIDTDVEVIAGQVLSVGITATTSLGQLDMTCILCERNVTASISMDRLS